MPLYSMKRTFSVLLYTTLILAGCTIKKEHTMQSINEVKLHPVPYKLLYKRGFFELKKTSKILLNLSNNNEKEIANQLIQEIKKTTGYKLKIADRFTTSKIRSKIEINFNPDLKAEEYHISVSNTTIKINFNSIGGATYAIETLQQLLCKKSGKWMIPQLNLEDRPYTKFRGIYIGEDITISNTIIEQISTYRFNRIIVADATKIDSLYANNNITWISKFDTTDINVVSDLTPTNFYNQKPIPQGKVIFKISTSQLFNKDSLKIIEEAMWTRPEKKDIKKLKDHLTVNKPQTN